MVNYQRIPKTHFKIQKLRFLLSHLVDSVWIILDTQITSNREKKQLNSPQEMCDYNWEKYNYDFYGHPESDLPPGLLLTYPVKVYS